MALFQKSQNEADATSLLPAIRILLQGIAGHINRHATGRQSPQLDVKQLLVPAEGSCTLPEATAKAEAAVRVLRDHADRMAKHNELRFAEQRTTIGAFIKVLEELSIASPCTLGRLKEVGNRLLAATEADGLRTANLELLHCLDEVKREAERMIDAGDGPARDPVTKLPGRSQAQIALTAACSSSDECCAVALRIERLPLYNLRYGREVGDAVVSYFASFVERAFEPGDMLFRWSGPAILMLRPGTVEKVQADVRQILGASLKFEHDTEARTILLSIDSCWSVFPTMAEPRLLINKIDGFVSS